MFWQVICTSEGRLLPNMRDASAPKLNLAAEKFYAHSFVVLFS